MNAVRSTAVRLGRIGIVTGALVAATASIGSGGVEADDPPNGIRPSGGGIELESEFQLDRTADQKLVSVIITLDEQPVASYDGSVPGFSATRPDIAGSDRLDVESAPVAAYTDYLEQRHAAFERTLESSVPGASVTHTYEMVIGGVAALVPLSGLDALAGLPGVTGVYRDELQQLQTDVSNQFIGADDLWAELGGQGSAGEGVIVGIVDSGIWPEHPSLSDPDPAGTPYDPPPATWTGTGTGAGCDFGDTAWNANDAAFACNNKLIGAYDFTSTYKTILGLMPTEFDSARDSNGHGTHTLTTSAGNGQVDASTFGIPRGQVSGVAPRAHVVAYKACGATGCFNSDTAAAIAQAVADGVDVVNFSISGGNAPYSDPVSLAMLDAYNAGTLVVASAGNSGPGADTVGHREPWTLTVAASTTDRFFESTVTLVAGNSDTIALTGSSITPGIATPTSVIYAPGGSTDLCLTPFAPGTFSGEIVICQRGVISRAAKSFNVAAGGAAGLILYNPSLQGTATDLHFIPTVHLENTEGADLVAFMDSHTGVTATFPEGAAATTQGDVMAPFSSRGGPGQTLGISKPDVTAPGVQILAGNTPLPEETSLGMPGEYFMAIQGTSMSAPHSTGSVALLRDAHPDWTPGQLRSALMMTALTAGVVKEDGSTPVDPFDAGSGRILPAAAADAQLTISETGANYLALEDRLWEANYPSLYVPALPDTLTVQRTVANTTPDASSWDLTVTAPAGLDVTVPATLDVPGSGEATFDITVDASALAVGEVGHATLELVKADAPMQGQVLHFPITVVRSDQGPITIDKTCDKTTIVQGETLGCTITVANGTFGDRTVSVSDVLPPELALDTSSVVGGTGAGNEVTFDGTLAGGGEAGPAVAVDPNASPYGYVSLASFSPTVVSSSDESITNFNVPSFDYAGTSYDQIGVVSNGYVVVGGGTAGDVDFVNTDLPDPAAPNNILAPFWTDLNPTSGGRILITTLTDGVDTWIVVEWESVRSWGDVETTTAQVWIGVNTDTNPSQDIAFTYGPDVSDGDGGFLTVGAESAAGGVGGTVYYDGSGAPPAPSFPNANPGYEVAVTAVPGSPGETHTITYDAAGADYGTWTNTAHMTGDGIVGTLSSGFSGQTDDVTPPSVTIDQAAGQDDPTNTSPVEFDVEFSEPVTDFDDTDVTLGGTANPTTATVTGTGTTYTVAVTGMTTDGTITATIPADAAQDAAGNKNTASTSTDNEVTYDTTGPSVTIDQAAGQDDPTNTSPVEFDVEFSEPVTDFDDTDVTLGGTANPTTATVTGTGTTYTVAVTGMTTDGTITATIPAGAATDPLGNPSPASTSTDNEVTWDTTGPTIVTPGDIERGTDPGQPGAIVEYTVSATDAAALTAAADVSSDCSPASGSFFEIGTTEVTCTAEDGLGNRATASFDVLIVDDEAPKIDASASVDGTIPSAPTGPLSYPEPTATDNSGDVTMTCTPPQGATVGLGTTRVTCTAEDAAGNTTTVSFDVRVTAPSLPATGGGIDLLGVAWRVVLAGVLLVTLTWFGRSRRRTSRVS